MSWRAALVGLVAFVGAAPSAARPGQTTTIPAEARAQFGVIVQAALELTNLVAAGHNLRGALQSWDRRWRRRLHGLSRAEIPSVDATSCEEREVVHLVDGTATAVWTTRTFVFSEQQDSLVPLARELAARRLLADDAARRRAASSSCADMPTLAETERSLQATTAASALLDVARRGRRSP